MDSYDNKPICSGLLLTPTFSNTPASLSASPWTSASVAQHSSNEWIKRWISIAAAAAAASTVGSLQQPGDEGLDGGEERRQWSLSVAITLDTIRARKTMNYKYYPLWILLQWFIGAWWACRVRIFVRIVSWSYTVEDSKSNTLSKHPARCCGGDSTNTSSAP